MVERVQKRSVFTYQSNFCSSRTGINTKETVSFVGGQILFHYFCLSMTLTELVEFFLIVEQRIQTLHLKGNLNLRLQAFDHFFSGDCFFFFGEKGRSGSCKQMGKLGDNGVLLIQLQGADKAFTQL